MSKVKDSYPNGLCPDCNESIPDNAPEGWTCPNCGHACYSETVEQEYTIVRRRTVTQICTGQYRAKNEAEALRMANKDQEDDKNGDAFCQDANEWHNLSDVVDYPFLDHDAVLEANPVTV